MLYRIYSGKFPLTDVADMLICRGIRSFSVVRQDGWWMGVPEASMVLDIFDESGELENQVYAAAEHIRSLSGQDVVYVAQIPLRVLKAVTA